MSKPKQPWKLPLRHRLGTRLWSTLSHRKKMVVTNMDMHEGIGMILWTDGRRKYLKF